MTPRTLTAAHPPISSSSVSRGARLFEIPRKSDGPRRSAADKRRPSCRPRLLSSAWQFSQTLLASSHGLSPKEGRSQTYSQVFSARRPRPCVPPADDGRTVPPGRGIVGPTDARPTADRSAIAACSGGISRPAVPGPVPGPIRGRPDRSPVRPDRDGRRSGPPSRVVGGAWRVQGPRPAGSSPGSIGTAGDPARRAQSAACLPILS